jgi:heme exporter protein D
MMPAFVAWLAMGGYAVFVWPAYGVAVVVLGGLALWSWRRHRQAAAVLESLRRGGAGRR